MKRLFLTFLFVMLFLMSSCSNGDVAKTNAPGNVSAGSANKAANTGVVTAPVGKQNGDVPSGAGQTADKGEAKPDAGTGGKQNEETVNKKDKSNIASGEKQNAGVSVGAAAENDGTVKPDSVPEDKQNSETVNKKGDPVKGNGEELSNNPDKKPEKKPDKKPEKKGDKINPAGEQVSGQSNGTGDPAKKENQPKPPVPPGPTTHSFFGDKVKQAMAAVIGLLLLTIAWLLNDRRKRNSKPEKPVQNSNPEPITSRQDRNNDKKTKNTLSPATNKQPVFRVGNLQNIGSREEQQDSFCISNITDEQALRQKGLMAVVADGMGGLEGGAAISKIVTDTFLKQYTQKQGFEPADFLYHAGKAAETAVEDFKERTDVDGGSTLIAVLIKGAEMNFISVGDSHIYLLRDGILKQQNRDHNFAERLKELVKLGEVDEDEPYVNPKRHSLTAYIGMGSFRKVNQNEQPIMLLPGDKVLLCSDGIYNALGEDALVSALAGDAMTAAKQIETNILKQHLPKQDNFTGIILEYVE